MPRPANPQPESPTTHPHGTANAKPLITGEQLQHLAKEDLYALLRKINERLHQFHVDDALAAAERVLKDHLVTQPTLVTITTDEWEDGYYYEGIDRIQDSAGADLELSERLVERLHDALKKPLTELSIDNHPGRRSELTIDLINRTVTPY